MHLNIGKLVVSADMANCAPYMSGKGLPRLDQIVW